MHVSVMYGLPLISGNGVLYDSYYQMCCDGVLTSDGAGYYRSWDNAYGTRCCGTQAYYIAYGLCCDGSLYTDLSSYYGDTCPSAPGL